MTDRISPSGVTVNAPDAITLEQGRATSLDEVVEAVATWQHEGGPVQIHPGDLGWHWRMSAEDLASALRVWRRDGQILAVGVADSGVTRLALAPSVDRDEAFAVRILADLPEGTVEARFGTALREVLNGSGWTADEAWTPLSRDLRGPVEDCGLRIELVGAHNAAERVAVHRAAFPSSTFTVERWKTMAAASPYRRARCLIGYDQHDTAVAAATVWSAGAGRPGLLEPLGVHRDHRGHGHGTAMSLAAAAALRDLSASSATVCTPSANVAAVATYASAGYRQHPDSTDFRRPS